MPANALAALDRMVACGLKKVAVVVIAWVFIAALCFNIWVAHHETHRECSPVFLSKRCPGRLWDARCDAEYVDACPPTPTHAERQAAYRHGVRLRRWWVDLPATEMWANAFWPLAHNFAWFVIVFEFTRAWVDTVVGVFPRVRVHAVLFCRAGMAVCGLGYYAMFVFLFRVFQLGPRYWELTPPTQFIAHVVTCLYFLVVFFMYVHLFNVVSRSANGWDAPESDALQQKRLSGSSSSFVFNQ